MIGPALADKVTGANAKRIVARSPNSIDKLRPEAKVVVAMNRLPITPLVTYYSIIGDRGENDSPNSSDGVVAYSFVGIGGRKPIW